MIMYVSCPWNIVLHMRQCWFLTCSKYFGWWNTELIDSLHDENICTYQNTSNAFLLFRCIFLFCCLSNVNLLLQKDVPARYLLRLGQGEQELATDLDFSRAALYQSTTDFVRSAKGNPNTSPTLAPAPFPPRPLPPHVKRATHQRMSCLWCHDGLSVFSCSLSRPRLGILGVVRALRCRVSLDIEDSGTIFLPVATHGDGRFLPVRFSLPLSVNRNYKDCHRLC
jgi:hypothetical protein